jgi:hypothetical protein
MPPPQIMVRLYLATLVVFIAMLFMVWGVH